VKYYDFMAEYEAETQAFSDANGIAKSPYKIKTDGTLTGVRIMVSRNAATSLTNGVIVRLTCTDFVPNSIQLACVGNGLQTAPAFGPAVFDFDLKQKVVNGHDIQIEGKCVDANAVTNSVLILARIEG